MIFALFYKEVYYLFDISSISSSIIMSSSIEQVRLEHFLRQPHPQERRHSRFGQQVSRFLQHHQSLQHDGKTVTSKLAATSASILFFIQTPL
jgi:hypothetical protein